MYKTLLQAMLILNYALAHEVNFSHISILARVNGHTFVERSMMSLLKCDYGRKYGQDEIREALRTAKDAKILIYKSEHENKVSLCFAFDID